MRKSCIECVLKHLGAAAIYVEEVELGYPNYFGYVYGELDHAASECLNDIPELAWVIREHRIKWANTRSEKRHHQIPFEAMFAYLDATEQAESPIEIPLEVFAGLDIGDDGKPVYTMDTRPDSEPSFEIRGDEKKTEN